MGDPNVAQATAPAAELEIRLTSLDPDHDAFGRQRVSDPVTILDSALIYDLQPSVWETVTAGSGTATHLPAEAAASLAVTGNGDRVLRQTRRFCRYNPGKGHLCITTGVFPPAATGVVGRIGYYDDRDGLYFERTATGLRVVQRSSVTGEVVNEAVEQADWGIDPMDGTGPSGIILDPSKANIYGWTIEWLGVGVTTAFVVIGGNIWPLHRFQNSNAKTSTYMRTASLPVRFELASTSAAATMKQICCTVISEGGSALASARTYAASNGTAVRSISVATPVIAIRPDLTIGTQTNRATILPKDFDLYTASPASNPVTWSLVVGGTVAGGTWGTVAPSSVLVNTGGTAIAGGVVVATGYDKPSAAGETVDLGALSASDLYLTVNAAGSVATEMALVVQPLSGSVTAGAAISWVEAR